MFRIIAVLLLAAAPAFAAPSAQETAEALAHVHLTAQLGPRMTEEEVKLAEAHLLQNPDDLDARYMLLGYFKASMSTDLIERKRVQLLWLIENRPEDLILGTGYGDVEVPLEYSTFEIAWPLYEKQIEANPKSTRILSNAARFAMRKDKRAVTRLLERAKEIEPDNQEWPRRLAGVYEFRTFHENRLEDRQLAYKYWAEVYGMAGEDEQLKLLPKLALTAVNATAYDEAKGWADKAMASVEKLSPRSRHGEAVNAAHTVYGRLALVAGDEEAAKRHLLASADMPGSMRLNNFGPNMRLAQMLAVKGHRDAVIEYLQACGSFWKVGQEKIDYWVQVLKEGDTPDFGKNLRL